MSVSETSRDLRKPAVRGTSTREREWAWREAHHEVLQKYAGQWVVLEGETIVGSGLDAAQAVEMARQAGIATPYVFFVERIEEGQVTLGL